MKFNSDLSKESLKRIYGENKEYSIPAVVVAVSFFLFLFFILPQILAFPENKREADLENEKLNKIKQALNFAKNADPQALDLQITTVTTTLPQSKDFETILSTIDSRASLSNTLILGYEFFETEILQTEGELTSIPSLSFKIEILGGPREAAFFIDELYISNPISEVTSVKTSEGAAVIDIIFYYKPFEILSAEEKIEIIGLSGAQQELFDQVSGWNNPIPLFVEEFEIPSTASGQRTSPF